MSSDYFIENKDIYLEILREAQKVEDPKLIRLIGSCLRQLGTINPVPVEDVKVIPFPGVYHHAVVDPAPAVLPESGRFWPRFGCRQILWFLTFYVAILLGGFIF